MAAVRFRTAFLAVLLVGGAVTVSAQPKSSHNPFTSDEDIAVGRQFYLGHCAQCHGHDGEGGRGVNLTAGRFKHGGSDAELFTTIQKGIRGTEMPRSRLPEPDLWKLISYVRSLTRQGGRERAPGDAKAGEAIYNGKGGCANCHVVNRKGSGLGPDLSDVGLRRSLVFLRESLTDPNAYIPQEYPAASAVTNDGKRVQGILLNEDDYTLQIRDMGENLHSLRKSELKSFEHNDDSLMPAYGSTLSAKELDDLVAYLSTLRGEQ